MAVTHGHGNPNWSRDEVILALDLYFQCRGNVPSKDDARVQALSGLLRSFPTNGLAARKPSFRNPDGVVFKLQNLRKVATGKGLGNVSNVDRAVWREFGGHPERAHELAQLISAAVEQDTEDDVADVEETFAEGELVTAMHSKRERDPRLRKKLMEQRRRSGSLACEVCDRDCGEYGSTVREAAFEAHHVIPLAVGKQRETKLNDLALLCANCHRMVHRAIAREKRWLTIAEARTRILT
jgi:5-methylcytosine-specific restriction enzyme A